MMTPAEYHRTISVAAAGEIRSIIDGTHDFLGPEEWRPVAYAAHAPAGVTVLPGVLRDCFDRAAAYLVSTFDDPVDTEWVSKLPASSEGRLLAGAVHALRWEERADMRRIVDGVVARVAARQAPEGYCLPYPVSFMEAQEEKWVDERRNYDRVVPDPGPGCRRSGGKRGSGAYPAPVLRLAARLPVRGRPHRRHIQSGSAHNCNNGHEGSLLAYFSPLGTPGPHGGGERVRAGLLPPGGAQGGAALPGLLPPAHPALLLSWRSRRGWITTGPPGAAKYQEAARGAWTIVHDFYEHVGGTIAICEEGPGDYLPGSYHLRKHTGETCGSVFWADFNHRFHQLFPEEERYAEEVETVVFNVILAAQDARGMDPLPQPSRGREGQAAPRQHLLRGHGGALHHAASAVPFSLSPRTASG